MRNSVNIFWGRKTSDVLLLMHKYMLHSAEGDTEIFFRSYLYSMDDKEVSIERVMQDEEGEYILSEECKFALSKVGEEAPKFVLHTHKHMVNIQNKGDFSNLHLCLYVPLLEDIKQVLAFVGAIEKGGFNYVNIDIICLAGDLCKTISKTYGDKSNLLELQKISAENLKMLVDYRKKHSIIQHLLAIQDYQNGGTALSLQLASLTRILGEFSLLMIENYISVFGNIPSESDFQTIGLSMLQLDRFYFQEYILRKSLKQIAEREKISIEQVDINMATKRADDLLRPWMNLLRDTYRKEVKSALERQETETEVVAKIDDYLNAQFHQMRTELESYITDEELSLPEKKAILSAILGQDDELFVNDIFDEELLNINDLEKEAIEQFTSTNNYILQHEDYKYDAILSEEDEEATYPIDKVRKNRIKLRRKMGHLRELNEEQKRLENQMEMQKHASECFIGDSGFTIGERTYKLLPHVDNEPLQEDYKPHSTSVPSVDISAQMPRVKDQGTQGACLAFALTSVFEYLYKNMTQQNIDLSEQFLYYNAREKAGDADKDEGSYLKYAVESLDERGICLEDMWPYGRPETAYNIPPSEEAYQDGLNRILGGAMNVAVDIDAIRSALSDGLPVIISARLYDSFGGAANGFVPMPTEEERKAADSNMNRNHAMVIVGYNDEIKAFKVRNSWGQEFGMGGYVLMPYAYIADPLLIDYAAVVTEIKLARTIVEKYPIHNNRSTPNSIPRLEFDTKDTKTQYGINNMMISEAKSQLRELEQIDTELSTYCLKLKSILKDPLRRDQLRKTALVCYEEDIETKTNELNQTYVEKSNELTAHESRGRRKCILYGLVLLLITAFFVTTSIVKNKHASRAAKYTSAIEKYEREINENGKENVNIVDPFSLKETTIDSLKWNRRHNESVKKIISVFHIWWIVVTVYLAIGMIILLSFIQYVKRKKEIVERYDDRIDHLSKEKGLLQKAHDELGVKFYLAGTMLSQFFTINDQLETKSKILKSFIINSNALSEENSEILKGLNPDVQTPFIPTLRNKDLDVFFDRKSDSLAVNTRLYHFFEGYSINNDAFNEFQVELKKRLNMNLDNTLKDFSMYKYLSGQVNYPYLSYENRQASDFLTEMDEKSEVFMLCNDTVKINPLKTLYVHTDSNEEMLWQNTYRRAFSNAPVCVNINSRFKIILLRLLDLDLKQVEWYV